VLAVCMHRKTADSSDLSVCSANKSRQTTVAVTILAAALGTDKALWTLSRFSTKEMCYCLGIANSTEGESGDDAGLYKNHTLWDRNKHLEKRRYRMGNIIKMDLSYVYRELWGIHVKLANRFHVVPRLRSPPHHWIGHGHVTVSSGQVTASSAQIMVSSGHGQLMVRSRSAHG